MEISLTEVNDTIIAELVSDRILISTLDDALDLIGNCGYQGAECVIIRKENMVPAFFDLKTGLAGEILQKFSNYAMRLAIVGDLSEYSSKSLKDFVYESNKANRICFVSSLEEAKEKLSR